MDMYGETVVVRKQKLNSHQWWETEIGTTDQGVPSQIFDSVSMLAKRYRQFYYNMMDLGRKYEDKNYFMFQVSQNVVGASVQNYLLSLNVAASSVDTLCSKICKHTPAVTYVTNDADELERKKAKMLQKYTNGVMLDEKVYQKNREFFRDMCIYGSGIFHIKMNYKKIRSKDRIEKGDPRITYDPVKPFCLFYDWFEGINGKEPHTLYIVEYKNRYALAKEFCFLYPERSEEIIEKCKTAMQTMPFFPCPPENKDMILVITSYSQIAERHTISISNYNLCDEKFRLYDKNGEWIYPIVKKDYKKSQNLWQGIGIVEEVFSIQKELDYLVRTAQRSSYLLAVPKIFAPRSANVKSSRYDNSIGGIIEFDGNQFPIPGPLGTVPVDLFNQIESFYRRAYERVGISQLSASSQVPSSLSGSGKALSTYYQIESDRFQMTAKNWEESIIDLNDITLYYMQMLDKEGKILKSNYYDQDISKVIEWEDVEIDRDRFNIQTFPTSLLPQDPSERFARVQEYLQLNLLDPLTAKKLMQMPDIDAYATHETAELDYVYLDIARLAYKEDAIIEPSDYQNIPMAIEIAKKCYFDYSNKKLNPKNLMRIKNYILQLQMIQEQQQVNMIAQQKRIEMAAMQQLQQEGMQNVTGNTPNPGELSNVIGASAEQTGAI